MNDDVARAGEAAGPLADWSHRLLLAGLAGLVLGTILVVTGVTTAGLLRPGMVILDIALLGLVASGVLRVLTPDA